MIFQSDKRFYRPVHVRMRCTSAGRFRELSGFPPGAFSDDEMLCLLRGFRAWSNTLAGISSGGGPPVGPARSWSAT